MAVVAFRAGEEPHRVLITVYTVQAYWLDREEPKRGKFAQFASMEAALRAGKLAALRSSLVVVQRVRGNVEADYWEAPVTLAIHDGRPLMNGATPSHAARPQPLR